MTQTFRDKEEEEQLGVSHEHLSRYEQQRAATARTDT